jgi:hypothetical protein
MGKKIVPFPNSPGTEGSGGMGLPMKYEGLDATASTETIIYSTTLIEF